MKKFALLVGVEQYKDKLITPLQFATADVKALAERLRQRCAFDQVRVLAEGQEADGPPDWDSVVDALGDMAGELRPEDLFLFFFSGHGVEVGGHGYLLTRDTRQAYVEQRSLSLEHLRRTFERLQAGRRVLLLDACRNDPHGGKGDAANPMADAISKDIVAAARANPAPDIATVLLSACRVGQRAYEWTSKGHGVFTHYLLEGLDGAAWAGEGLEFRQLAAYTQREVRRWSLNTPGIPAPQDPWFEQFGSAEPIMLFQPTTSGPVSTAGALSVTSTPPDAGVFVDSQLRGRTPCKVTLDLGPEKERQLEIVVTKDGYLSHGVRVTLQRGQELAHEVNLQPLPAAGALSVTSTPSDAEVVVDGQVRGQTPCDIEIDLAAHEQREVEVRITKKGYRPFESRETLRRGQRLPIAVALKRIRASATVSMTSTPADAEVSVDGRAKGRTPCEVKVHLGAADQRDVEVVLTKDGYQPHRAKLTLCREERLPLAVTLERIPATATLSVTSVPPEAEVCVDGHLKGQTPCELKVDLGGADQRDVEVVLTKDGYQPHRAKLTLCREQRFPLAVVLERISGTATLSVSSTPADADVSVDGQSRGRTPCEVKVGLRAADQRDVEVVVAKDGFQPHQSRMTLRRGESFSCPVTLVRKTPTEPALPTGFDKAFAIPAEATDQHGNPVVTRHGSKFDPETGWPYEIWLNSMGFEHEAGLVFKRTEKVEMPRVEFVLVRAGEFLMGSPDNEEGRGSSEGPVHRVQISKPFYMSKYEVTQACYGAVTGNNPSHFKFRGSARPVDSVCWHEALSFCKTLSQKAGVEIRLPTEAEWEYVCRAGSPWRFSHGDDPECVDVDDYGWHLGNSGSKTRPVGQKKPNAWGFHDMHGNVCEWCSSALEGYPYRADGGREDLSRAVTRVLRGGCWGDEPERLRCANRWGYDPVYAIPAAGFRVLAPVPHVSSAPQTPPSTTDDLTVPPTKPVFAAATPEAARAGETRVNPADDAVMVWIPGGEFLMGKDEGDIEAEIRRYGWEPGWKDDLLDEIPKRRVRVEGFWMYRYEVTMAQYRKFCQATGHPLPPDPSWGKQPDDHPVVNVTWEDAKAYAEWAGCHLPTEAQWEYAASGGQPRTFPWGDEWHRSKCNNASYHADSDLTTTDKWKSEFTDKKPWKEKIMTSPVGSFPQDVSPFGCMDMAGNVAEWSADWCYWGRGAQADSNYLGDRFILARGGSWRSAPKWVRCSLRSRVGKSTTKSSARGFRCCKPA